MKTALPEEIIVRDELDGVRYVLPGRGENPIRRQAGMLLVVVGVSDGVITVTLLVVLLMQVGNVSPVIGWLIGGAIMVSAVMIVLIGLWLFKARTEIEVGRDAVRSVTRLGPLRFTRRRRVDTVERLTLEVEKMKGVNMPGYQHGTPGFLTLRAAPGRAGAPGTILATGYHERLMAPLAQELAMRMGTEVVEASPPGRSRRSARELRNR